MKLTLLILRYSGTSGAISAIGEQIPAGILMQKAYTHLLVCYLNPFSFEINQNNLCLFRFLVYKVIFLQSY